jgi:hypothetical protein
MEVQDLKEGQSLLTSVRRLEGGKFYIELAEVVKNPEAKVNLLALLNKGDERFTFNESKARRAWMATTAEGLLILDIDVTKLEFSTNDDGNDVAMLNILNPNIDGEQLRIQITDSLERAKNWTDQKPKQTTPDKDGNYKIFVDGNMRPIFQTTSIVVGEPVHTIIKSVARVSVTEIEPVVVKSAMSLNA